MSVIWAVAVVLLVGLVLLLIAVLAVTRRLGRFTRARTALDGALAPRLVALHELNALRARRS